MLIRSAAVRTPRRVLASIAFVCVVAASAIAGPSDPWQAPAGHYDSATGAGAALKSQLYDIMRIGHIERRYGNFRSSAAIHDADPSASGNILLVYDRASVDATWDQGATWNREHVWPQSRQPGSASNSTRGNLGDPHALRPATPFVNGSRSNKPFGLASTTGLHGSLGLYYFPGDDDKGDIARSLFYSETRYGPELGLALVPALPSGNQMGDLNSLVAWHYLDPPDEFERRRNHTIFSSDWNPIYYTNNRNAFVDRPEFVWSIYVDQQNDSQIYVGAAPDADGGSVAMIDLGAALAGGPAPDAQPVTISRSGFDGAYFEVSPEDGAVSDAAGRFNAFPINTVGADDMTIDVGFDPAGAGPGMHSGIVWIDNLDITTGAGVGFGAQDADDAIVVTLTLLDSGDASFAPDTNVDVATVDLGEADQNQPAPPTEVTLHHLEDASGLVAPIDIELIGAVGDTGAFIIDFTEVSALPPGGAAPFDVRLDTAAPGAFESTFTFRVHDDRTLPGAEAIEDLVLQLEGVVALDPCAADIDGSGVIDSADLATLLGEWGGPGSADINGDGEVNSADLANMLGAWGPCQDN